MFLFYYWESFCGFSKVTLWLWSKSFFYASVLDGFFLELWSSYSLPFWVFRAAEKWGQPLKMLFSALICPKVHQAKRLLSFATASSLARAVHRLNYSPTYYTGKFDSTHSLSAVFFAKNLKFLRSREREEKRVLENKSHKILFCLKNQNQCKYLAKLGLK